VEERVMSTDIVLEASAREDLDARIAAAFNEGVKSDTVAGLIREAQTAATDASSVAEEARTRALDPAMSAADVVIARREMEDAIFQRDRMQEAVRRLGERLQEVEDEEEWIRRKTKYDEVAAERDKLAIEFEEVYETAARRIADIVARVDANDRFVQFINAASLPKGMKPMLGAELVARGLESFSIPHRFVPRITEVLRLPSWGGGWWWPR
jgi:hypothetical protein